MNHPEEFTKTTPNQNTRGPELGGTPTSPKLHLVAVLLRTRHAPDHHTGRCPAIAPLQGASRSPGVGQTCGRTSAGDPSETPHACRGAAVVEAEVAAERGPAAVPEQCCSGWPSSASGAGSTAPESEAKASGSRSPSCSATGCSAPAGQNHTWSSPSDLNKRCMSEDIAEIIQTDMITFCEKDLGMIK